MQKSTKISQIMSDNVIVALPGHTFSQVCRLFLEMGMHHLPVVDADNVIIGIISSYDVLKAYRYSVPDLAAYDDATLDSHLSIKQLMTANPATLTPSDTIGNAAELFVQLNIQALPIVDANNKVIGIISNRDLIRQFATIG
jgi:acetoin utilization protein AcuB